MRLRNVPGAKERIAASPYCEMVPEPRKGHWQEFFGGQGPLYLEIGCGKGRFLAELAQRHPEINYLGVEKYTSVLLRAVQKQETLALPNLRFVRMEAEILTEVFDRGEIGHIYLNFSDPWPKERHAQKRLPSASFLRRYEEVLAPGGTVELKTDNTALFDFALGELPTAGWEADVISRDLHADPVLSADNCMTEYEARFSAQGNPICYAVIHKKGG
ncbi:MAG: tRNA (guanosine(46)-N7)-methyltransferase TrmB [Lachnospiraceae bacterium]|nr:tRNA (guanosine(46)-N7)-methyltransferase TrmB [Lachnospiraceae bacterium]